MRLLDLTLPTPEANLALDEALLNTAEAVGMETHNVLRFWESPVPFVVVGRASRVRDEVNLEACQSAGIPVLRRCSGGTAVVAGPGCLMYAVLINLVHQPHLRSVDRAHEHVMQTMARALSKLAPVSMRGSCDLVVDDRKISGNSLRLKRKHLLYHGTVLYDFDLGALTHWLGIPPREPEYRRGRPHESFVRNFPFPVSELKAVIRSEWRAVLDLRDWPQRETERLVQHRYSKPSWNERL